MDEEYTERPVPPDQPVNADAGERPEPPADDAADLGALDESSFEPSVPEAQEDMPQEIVEPFLPTDFYQKQHQPRKKRRHKRRKNRLWLIPVILGVLLLAIGGFYVFQVRNNPSAFFGAQAVVSATPSPTPATQSLSAGDATPAPTAVPSPTPLDPYQELYAKADQSMMQNIVNVLVIGVDYAEERETWNGKHDYHADVMMMLAINFDENRVDLISMPRDTYAKIPGVKGIYKLNASLNCGGGLEAAGGAGFLKVCESTSWMLGGIPVNYYYAVTMPAVKGLVDAVGGVDYDLELSYTMMGRRYKAGQQHMDGQAVLDYLRVRKNVASSGDLNRVNRQKKMMVALFESMQNQNLILKIPDIISSFNGQLYTDCTLGQTAALASFAYNLSSEKIGMHSMGGTMRNIFNWNFCITDQENRVQIIKDIYGIDVPEEKEYAMAYAKYRWGSMQAERYLKICDDLTDYVAARIAEDDRLPPASVAPEDPYTPPDGVVGGDDGGGTAPVITPDPNAGGGVVIPEGGGVAPDGGGVIIAGMQAAEPSGLSVVRLARRLQPTVLEAETQQYDASARELFASYKSALRGLEDTREDADKQAQKYLSGQKNSLSSEADALLNYASQLRSYAEQLQSIFGYSGSMNWTYRFDKDSDFNEIYVDFN